jgi:hypothetical protein
LIYYKQIGDFVLNYTNDSTCFDVNSDVWEITRMNLGFGNSSANTKFWNPESCSVSNAYFYRTNLIVYKGVGFSPALPYCTEPYTNLASGYTTAADWSYTNPGSYSDAYKALEGFEHWYWATINRYNSTGLTNGFKWFR